MTSFVHLDYSNQHSGVTRVESAIETAQQIKRDFSSTRTLATLLLSAIAAAAMVVAYQVMDSLAEGHLLALWIGLWLVAFATLATFAGTVRRAVAGAQAGLDAWSRGIAARRADERLWAIARTDARVMADLQCAITRGEIRGNEGADSRDDGLVFIAPAVTPIDRLAAIPVRYGKVVPHF